MEKIDFKFNYNVSQQKLWDWHNRLGAFQRLQPTWAKFKLLEAPIGTSEESLCRFKIKQMGIWLNWVARHGKCKEPFYFSDYQEKGPFNKWIHFHRLSSTDNGIELHDDINYKLPLNSASKLFFIKNVERELKRVFAFRHQRLKEDSERFGLNDLGRGKIIVVTGHRGGVGSRLVPLLQTLGFEVRGLTRSPRNEGEYYWNPMKQEMDESVLKGVYGIIHLAGHGIADSRWTAATKQLILESRIFGTRLLGKAISQQQKKPEVFVSASGVNIYKSDGEEHDESEVPDGDGFLAQVCRSWEAEADKLEDQGCRLVKIRTGVVIDPLSGALSKMLIPFKLGFGGKIGDGKQLFPWISIDDLCDIYVESIINGKFKGCFNAVAPQKITQSEFSKTLAEILNRPSFFNIPEKVIKLGLGEMGIETLLSNLNISPKRLLKSNYCFRHSKLESTLKFLLGK